MHGSRRGSIFAATVATVAVVFGLVSLWVRVETPSLGVASIGLKALDDGAIAVKPIPGSASPLGGGDAVVAIDGLSMSALANDLLDMEAVSPPHLQLGDQVLVTVRRGGTLLEIPVTLERYPLAAAVGDAAGAFSYGTLLLGVATFVFWRRPRQPAAAGLLIASAGVISSDIPFLLGWSPIDVVLRGPFWAYLVSNFVTYLLLWAGALHFALAFPRPKRLLQRNWTIPALYLGVFLIFIAELVVARLLLADTMSWIAATGSLVFTIVLPALALTLAVLAEAWRGGSTEDRRVLRWVGLTGAFSAVSTLAVGFIPEIVLGRSLLPWSVVVLFGLPIPIAIAAAVLRDHAFDIEVVVDRSLVYGGLSLAILAIYTTTATALGAVFRQEDGFAASLLATGAAALLALTIRDGLQRWVSRLVYGDRDDPYRALARLGQRLDSTLEPELIPTIIVDSVAEALRLPYVALEIGSAGALEVAAVHGRAVTTPVRLPLVHGTDVVGQLLLAHRSPDEVFSSAEQGLLDDLARSAGAAVHATQLTLDVLRSRERLVTAREEERRRLRRDLHDGLGPALAGMAMRAEAAAELFDVDRASARMQLDELRTEARAALHDIRRLVNDLRPPALDELGLIGAIRQHASRLSVPPPNNGLSHVRSALEVDVQAPDGLPTLPAAVEVAAYRIAIEALTNAARHADARQCAVRLLSGRDLTIEVRDDGRGMPTGARSGVGLTSMRERAAELGGSIVVEPNPDGGTRVWARLPLPDQATSA